MRELLAFIFPCFVLYLYMVLSSIEFGASVFNAWPKLLQRGDALKTYLSPIWEATNVFLVTFIVCMFSFFPRAAARFGTDLLMVIFPGLVFLGLRVLGMLLIYYGGVRSKAVNVMYVLGSFLAPMTLSLVFIYMLTGSWADKVWSPVFLGLAGTVASTIVFVSATFFRWFAHEKFGGPIDRVVRWAFATLLPCFMLFNITVCRFAPQLFSSPARVAAYFIVLALPVYAFLHAERSSHASSAIVAACALVAAMFLPFVAFQIPYVIYPTLTVFNSFTDPASFDFMTIATGVGVILVVPALILLYRLFIFAPRAGRSERVGK